MKMRIMVVSDTHGNYNALLDAYEAAEQPDAIIHLGDGETDINCLTEIADCQIISVAGNCDRASSAPKEIMLELGGKQFLICHGDCYAVKSGLSNLIRHGHESGADLVLYGHTHIAMMLEDNGIYLINPGALAGYAEERSYAMIDIEDNSTDIRFIPV